MKKKEALSIILAFVLSLHLTGCSNFVDKIKEDTTSDEKKYEDFVDKETLEKVKKDILELIDEKVSDVDSKIDDLKTSVESKFDELIDKTSEDETDVIPKIEVRNFAYLNSDTSICSDVNMSEEIDSLLNYQKVFRLMDYENGVSLVEYYQDGNPKVGYVKTSTLVNLPNLFVEVDLTRQEAKLIIDNEVVYTTNIVTGKPSTPTRVGYFDIDSHEKNRYLTGPGYRSYVNYWMPFDGGIGLHDADGWRTSEEYGKETYKTNGSHGCVNMPNEAAKVFYENVHTGDMVLVHK